MTETEKIRKLDAKLKPRHPELSGEAYTAFRNRYIRSRNRLAVCLALLSLVALFVGCVVMFRILRLEWGGWLMLLLSAVLGVAAMVLRQDLPASLARQVKDTPAGTLTVDVIAADCKKVRRNSTGWFFLVLCLGLAAYTLCVHGWDSQWWLPLPFAALSAYFILRARRKGDALEKQLLEGEFHLICSPLNDKEVEEDNSGDSTTYTWRLFFNIHPEHGRYVLKTNANAYTFANIGDEYYLVLHKDQKGSLNVLQAYQRSRYTLDSHLQGILRRDVALTGETGSRQAELEEAQKLLKKLFEDARYTPEQEAEELPRLKAQVRKSMMWLAVAAGFTLVFLVLLFIILMIRRQTQASWLTPGDIAWYWKLLCTVGYLGLVGFPVWKHLKLMSAVSVDLDYRLNDQRQNPRNGCLHVALMVFVVFGAIMCGVELLVLWCVLS